MGRRELKKKIGTLPFDLDARFALARACEAAIEWGHPHVAPGHLLYGLQERSPELLAESSGQLTEERIRTVIEAFGLTPGGSPKPVPYSDRLRKVLAVSREEAFRSEMEAVSPAHLLLALRVHGGRACAAILEGEDGPPEGPGPEPVEPDEIDLTWVRVSDESTAPYPHQLAAQIRDAIASGHLLPGQRLPTVRHLAEQLDLAPGTVGKAYKALEASGVVQTARSKGTIVSLPIRKKEGAEERLGTLEELLRPVAVTAFHMGSNAQELEAALKRASKDVFGSSG